jgi:hypothetical protein
MKRAQKYWTIQFLVPIVGQVYEITFFNYRKRGIWKKGKIVAVSRYGTVLFLETEPQKRQIPYTMFIAEDEREGQGSPVRRWVIYTDGSLKNVATVGWDPDYHWTLERVLYVHSARRGVTRLS